MKQGSFEEGIRKKFENQSVTPPPMVWDNVEKKLDKRLLGAYMSSNRKYKYASIAAAIVLLISSIGFAFHLSTEHVHDDQQKTASYNALLKNKNYFLQNKNLVSSNDITVEKPVFIFLGNTDKKKTLARNRNNFVKADKNIIKNQPIAIANYEAPASTVSRKEIELIEPNISTPYLTNLEPIYVYNNYTHSLAKNTDNSNEDKIWTGLTAGVGANEAYAMNGTINNNSSPALFSSANSKNKAQNSITVPTSQNVSSKMQESIAQSISLGMGMKISPKWTLESGLAYTNIQSKGQTSVRFANVSAIQEDGQELNPSTINGLDNTDDQSARRLPAEPQFETKSIDIESATQYASIPVKVGYLILDKQVSLKVNAGMLTNYMIQNKVSDNSSGLIANYKGNITKSDLSFQGIGSVEIGYNIADRLDLTIEPSYRKSLEAEKTATLPSQAMVMTGIRYILK